MEFKIDLIKVYVVEAKFEARPNLRPEVRLSQSWGQANGASPGQVLEYAICSVLCNTKSYYPVYYYISIILFENKNIYIIWGIFKSGLADIVRNQDDLNTPPIFDALPFTV